jgi:hypothetical protein
VLTVKQAEAASGCEQQQKQQQDSGFGSFSIAYAIGSIATYQCTGFNL